MPLLAAAGTAVVLVLLGIAGRFVAPLGKVVTPIRNSLPVWVLVAFAFGMLAFWVDGAAADVDDLRPAIGPLVRLVAGVIVTTVVVLGVFSITPVRLWLHRRPFGTQMRLIGAPGAHRLRRHRRVHGARLVGRPPRG